MHFLNERDQFGLIPSFAGRQFAQMGFSCMGDLWDKNAGKWLSWTTLNQYQRDQLVDSPTFTTNFQIFPDYCLSYTWFLMDLLEGLSMYCEIAKMLKHFYPRFLLGTVFSLSLFFIEKELCLGTNV